MPGNIDCPMPPIAMTAAACQEDSGTTNAAGGIGGTGTPSETSTETLRVGFQDSQTIIPPAVPTAVVSSSTAENPAVDDTLSITDVTTYLNEVRLKFANQPQHYRSFLQIMHEFHTQSGADILAITKRSEAFERLARLLKDHAPDLIPGFNKLSPTDLSILVDDDAVAYLELVKLTFVNQPQVYDDFVNMMKELKSESIDVPCFIKRVAHLFKDHTQLLFGFNSFLPYDLKIRIGDNNRINVCNPEPAVPAPSTSSAPSTTSANSQTFAYPPTPTATMRWPRRPRSQTPRSPRHQPYCLNHTDQRHQL